MPRVARHRRCKTRTSKPFLRNNPSRIPSADITYIIILVCGVSRDEDVGSNTYNIIIVLYLTVYLTEQIRFIIFGLVRAYYYTHCETIVTTRCFPVSYNIVLNEKYNKTTALNHNIIMVTRVALKSVTSRSSNQDQRL